MGEQSWEDRQKKKQIKTNILHSEQLSDCLKLIAKYMEFQVYYSTLPRQPIEELKIFLSQKQMIRKRYHKEMTPHFL